MDSELLNDLLECSVCLKPLDDKNKVLPCQHTFCKTCLQSIVKSHKELRCPECRVVVRHKVDDLPSNILLIRLLDGIKFQQNQKRLNSSTENYDTRRYSVEGILTTPIPASGGAKDGGIIPSPSHAEVARPTSLHERASSEPANGKMKITSPRPHARAVFAYESEHTSDLSFAKGDTIHLLKKIDANWMSGECNGRTGVFPTNYVEILRPIPDERPFCVALYDFESDQNDKDRDCIKFAKNDRILVIRKVDDNWAEGMLKDKIGIFPLSFVKLNDEARKLVEDKSSPSDAKEESRPHRSGIMGAAARKITISKMGGKNAKKRHSFPTFLSEKTVENVASNSSHRHSMELVSSTSSSVNVSNPASVPAPLIPSDDVFTNANLPSSSSVAQNEVELCSQRPIDVRNVSGGSKALERVPVTLSSVMKSTSITTSTAGTTTSLPGSQNSEVVHKTTERSKSVERVLLTTRTSIPTLATSRLISPPKIVTASYAYHGQKQDELELVKGDTYRITEVCNDGWCKGCHIRTGKLGMFPGNYVTPTPVMLGATTRSSPTTPRLSAASTTVTSSSTTGQLVPNRSYEQFRQMQQHKTAAFETKQSVGQPSSSNRPSSKSSSSGSNRSKSASSSKSSIPAGSRTASGIALSASPSTSKALPPKSPPPRPVAAPASLKLSNSVVTANGSNDASNQARNSTSPSSGVKSASEQQGKHRKKSADKVKTKEKRSSLLNMIPGSGKLKSLHPSSSRASSSSEQRSSSVQNKPNVKPLPRDRYYATMNYPANGPDELPLREGDVIVVHSRSADGWFKGTHQRSGKTGLFPSTFVARIPKDV